MNKHNKIISLLLAALMIFGSLCAFSACNAEKAADTAVAIIENLSETQAPSPEAAQDVQTPSPEAEAEPLDEHGTYTTKEDVALYIYTYGRLPENFVTKKEAEAAGWSGGSLEKYLPGKCIGGSYFGNYEGLLPKADGRKWTECDINTLGESSRGAERIVFSNDGLIYYTGDHYKSFERLY